MGGQTQTGYHGSSPHGPGTDIDEEDYYALLGVPFSATHAEITRAFRRAMKRAHPDRQHPEHREVSEDLARRLNAAYAVLSDPLKRQGYDRTIRQQVIQDQIMRQYVGGFQDFGGNRGPASVHRRREPTAAERRERLEADRRASWTLILVATGVTAIILLSLIVGSFLGSVVDAIR